ncbi:MAG: TIGR02587 family membrane protein [Leptolyngbyaceae cyanobacterium SL_1_1]|nr:TIGR02587 family membrane protein [Leptolyngbyaceae cyanobacterium RM2_2_21]NJN04331.1 TIGR02587 family membrane protein [Leptolyngbyaceae cyanobacterium RM1_1_2]NJO10561.1 TIGR02587 family membrane protein [Leptolyngbyaceae cyanobacterium SL_1_1]
MRAATVNIWREELKAVLRGAAGSFLFGIPLLYTVEVWSIGSAAQSPLLLAVLGTTFIVVLLLTEIEGFRRTLTLHPIEAILESIEALGIGLVCAAIALVLLRRVTLETPLSEALGKLIFEGVPFSIGVALARSILSRDRLENRTRRTINRPRLLAAPSLSSLRDTLVDFDATLIGAILIAFSIAPTEEIPILAADIPPLWLLWLMAASLLFSYGIVFASGFSDRSDRRQRGLLISPTTETLVAYLVALLASITMLVFFQQLTLQDPWQEWLGDTIVLALPAAIGGAAGRILI